MWAEEDLNLRRLSRQIYSLFPLTAWVSAHYFKAAQGNRTPNLLITNQLLYQLS